MEPNSTMEPKMNGVESVGTMEIIYTVEPDPQNDKQAIVSYWLKNGAKIGVMSVPRKDE